jgi:hypothetical protein
MGSVDHRYARHGCVARMPPLVVPTRSSESLERKPMKVSEFLRQYQITGKVPDEVDSELAFWSGWLLASGGRVLIATKEQHFQTAIAAAEFIESRCHE